MGMAYIFRSRKIFELVNGFKKSEMIARAMTGPVTESVPASMLQMHPNVSWILDEDAAGPGSVSTEADMEALDHECRELLPSVEVGKVLYHIIPESFVPEPIGGEIGKIARETRSRRERIKIVKDKEFLSEIQRLSSDANNVVLAAVPEAVMLSGLPKGVKALVFVRSKISEAYDFEQIEGIIAALRALERADAAALTRIYRILTGSPFKGSESDIIANIGDPKMLSMYIIFNLKPIIIEDYTELERLNNRLITLLRNA
jgi:hypothetical protein